MYMLFFTNLDIQRNYIDQKLFLTTKVYSYFLETRYLMQLNS